MRHSYTPIFRDLLTSSMWITDPATRCVWIAMLLSADPEGFVCATLPGLANLAVVSLEQAEAAIRLPESPDRYSATKALEGRRIIPVERGWHIVNFVARREMAKHEGEKARKRKWAQKNRQLPLPFPTEVDATSTDVDANPEKVDAPKPKPKLLPSEGESPLPPEVVDSERVERWREHALPIAGELFVHTHHTLDGMDEAGLEDEAVMAGISREWFRERLTAAHNIRIGGTSGVRDQREWVRQQFGKWKTWEEDARAKNAQRQAAAAPRSGFRGAPVPVEPLEPDAAQMAFARRHGLPLDELVKGVLADHPQPLPAPLSRRAVLGERLTVAAKQARAGFPPTGRLTTDQLREWGPVPPGGAIPELDGGQKGAA